MKIEVNDIIEILEVFRDEMQGKRLYNSAHPAWRDCFRVVMERLIRDLVELNHKSKVQFIEEMKAQLEKELK